MTTITLPLSERAIPASVDELIACVGQARAQGLAIYPVGGGTSLGYGLVARVPGMAIETSQLNRVIDYPARDMTITVEAGITMAQLSQTLAEQGQWLPIDVPQADRATLGGVIATNFSGPRRFGQGTMRDYVIGIEGVAADGCRFKAGGRVVKNVAGYDFCKLLTGSLGSLAIITQVTLKVKPRPQQSRIVWLPLANWKTAETELAALNLSPLLPTAIEIMVGKAWDTIMSSTSVGLDRSVGEPTLAVLLEGSLREVDWMADELLRQWQGSGSPRGTVVAAEATDDVLQAWAEFPAAGNSALVLKIAALPSQVTCLLEFLQQAEPGSTLLAHAGDGIIVAKFDTMPDGGLSQLVVKQLRPMAQRSGGHVVVLSNPEQGEMTHQAVWGGSAQFSVMGQIKRAWDPDNVLNPGRFVYDG